jgi:predicted nucleic acid-binding Zn ribbon protein
MDSLKDIIGRFLKSTPLFEDHQLKVRVFDAWPKLVGERVAQHCWPTRLFDDGTLLVGAESSVWLHSLRYLETQILTKYETELGEKKVRALRFKLEVKARPRA